MTLFVVSQPNYDGDNIDSIWTVEEDALAQARELGGAFMSEYRANEGAAWVRNGWAPTAEPRVWSDWGYSTTEAAKRPTPEVEDVAGREETGGGG